MKHNSLQQDKELAAHGCKSTTGREQRDVFVIDSAAKVRQYLSLSFRRPEYPQVLSRPSDRCIEDAVCQVIFVGVGDDNLHRVIF
jgi:hypothetical protein